MRRHGSSPACCVHKILGIHKIPAVAVATILLAVGIPRPGWSSEHASSFYTPGTYGDFGMAYIPGPGTYLKNSTSFTEGRIDRALLEGQLKADAKQTVYVDTVQGEHLTNWEILGANFGFGAIVPVVRARLSASGQFGELSGAQERVDTQLGDIALIPGLLSWQSDEFHVVAYEIVSVPTSHYNADSLVTIGHNYWASDTNVAVTWLDQQRGHEISVNAGLTVNGKNDATDYRTGKEAHLDALLGQYLAENFAIGLTGYYYKQVTPDTGGGALLGSYEGEAIGVGPAAFYAADILGTNVMFSAKWLQDIHVTNRFKSESGIVSFGLKL